MNEKIVGWIAIAVILTVSGWVYKSNAMSETQVRVLVIALLVAGVAVRFAARAASRRTVIRRRRLYKAFWRREDRSTMTLNKDEEESIVLLGRIKAAMPTATIMVLIASGALYFNAYTFALVVTLGQIFLAAQLIMIARHLDRALPADANRDLPSTTIPATEGHLYIVQVDVGKVHDFIAPRSALPFWSIAETERWLTRCGFRRHDAHTWKGDVNALRFLDTDEIVSITSTEN